MRLLCSLWNKEKTLTRGENKIYSEVKETWSRGRKLDYPKKKETLGDVILKLTLLLCFRKKKQYLRAHVNVWNVKYCFLWNIIKEMRQNVACSSCDQRLKGKGFALRKWNAVKIIFASQLKCVNSKRNAFAHREYIVPLNRRPVFRSLLMCKKTDRISSKISLLTRGARSRCILSPWLSVFHGVGHITKTYLYNSEPLKPHFYIVKLGFTGVYIIFLISAEKTDIVGTR